MADPVAVLVAVFVGVAELEEVTVTRPVTVVLEVGDLVQVPVCDPEGD